MFTNPKICDFKTYFNRDFPYTANPQDFTKVQDKDIIKAFIDVDANINAQLFANQTSYNIGYLLLAAHYLVLNLRASSQGVNGQFPWLESSKSVGSVSESITIPQRILDNPVFAFLSKTTYGVKYLMMILPQLSGQVFLIQGRTTI